MNEKFSRDERAAIARLEMGIEWGTVLPVVGAGVSRQSAELPRWTSLLTEAIEWTRQQAELQLTKDKLKRLKGLSLDAPTPDCYETWTKVVFCRNQSDNHWETPEYREWLQSTFGSPSVVDGQIYDALRAMNPRVLATTNYDKLLTNEVMPDDPPVTWGQDEDIRALFREGRGVLHLHGIFSQPRSVVLTSSDYERVVQNDISSEVARMLASSAILLFIGVSPEGVTDRHLHELLKLGLGQNGNRQELRPHVLLHRGGLSSKHAAVLTSMGIEPVCFGDTYTDLAPFLERLSRRRSDSSNAIDLVGLDTKAGESLSDSRWAPKHCLKRVETNLRFMGLRSSKWVSDSETFEVLDRRLKFLDTMGGERVRFLILNPDSPAYERLENMRAEALTSDHLKGLAELEQRHRSLVIKCVDFISAFRFTAVDDREIGLALYPTTPSEFEETDRGWSVRHHSLVTDRSWSLGRSLVFMFDEHFREARSLREVKPELFS
jgi:hypothetical protein